jgi:hypothetical protein
LAAPCDAHVFDLPLSEVERDGNDRYPHTTRRLSNRFDLYSRRRHAMSWRRAAFNGLREFSITQLRRFLARNFPDLRIAAGI